MDLFSSSTSIGLGTSVPRYHYGVSPTQDDTSLEYGIAPRALQRKRNEPWTHLQSNDAQSPESTSRETSTGFDDRQHDRSQQADSSQGLPESQWSGQVVWQPGLQYEPGIGTKSGLSTLFAKQPEPPTVILDQQSCQLNSPSVEHQWPDSEFEQLADDLWHLSDDNGFGIPFNHISHPFPSDPPPSIFSTEESFFGEGSLEDVNTLSYDVNETPRDIHGGPATVLQSRRRSFAENECRYSITRDTRSTFRGDHAVFESPYTYDNRFLSPIDPKTRPEAVPVKPSNNWYKPGLAKSYPPAANDDPNHQMITTKRPLAPRFSGAVTECTTPVSQVPLNVNALAFVREDGKGGPLVSPALPKKGQRNGKYVQPHCDILSKVTSSFSLSHVMARADVRTV